MSCPVEASVVRLIVRGQSCMNRLVSFPMKASKIHSGHEGPRPSGNRKNMSRDPPANEPTAVCESARAQILARQLIHVCPRVIPATVIPGRGLQVDVLPLDHARHAPSARTRAPWLDIVRPWSLGRVLILHPHQSADREFFVFVSHLEDSGHGLGVDTPHINRADLVDVEGDDADGPQHDDADDEPSLGSFDRLMNQEDAWRQRVWSFEDAEHDTADREPSLGSVATSASSSQERWAAGGRQDSELDEADGPEGNDEREGFLASDVDHFPI
jgi:hypothetical protein